MALSFALSAYPMWVRPPIGLQRRRDGDAAVFLLVVLDHRHQGATHRQAGAIQGVQQLRLAIDAHASLHAARLEVGAVGDGGDPR